MKRETYILEVKMKDDSIKVFSYARWNYNTKEIEVCNSGTDFMRGIPFDEIEWFRKK